MGRSIIQKVLYKRRKFLTKKRIKSISQVVLKLLPAVIMNRPALAPLVGVLNELVQNLDSPAPPVNENNKKLCQQMKQLRAQIKDTPTEDADKLRKKIDALHALFLEDATLEDTP